MRYMLLLLGMAAQPKATDEQASRYTQQWGASWMSDLARDNALVAGALIAVPGS
jgi:hypothetical protein